MTKSPATLDDYGARYAAQYAEGGFETVLVGVRRRRVLETLARYPSRRVLEVGCGLEPLFPDAPDFDGHVVVEPIAAFATNARELAAGDDRVTVVEGKLEDHADKLAGEPFDFVVVSSLLHEVADPDMLLASVAVVCGDETVTHVNVPNVRSFHRLLALEMGLIADPFEKSATEKRFGRHTRYDRSKLIGALEQAGFGVLESGTYFVKPFAHDQMDRLFREGIVAPEAVEGFDRMIKYMPELGAEAYANVTRRKREVGRRARQLPTD